MNKFICKPIVITSILIILLCISCSETTTEVVIEPSWKLVEKLDYEDKIILNSYVTTDSSYYYLSTHYGFWKYQQGDDNPSVCYNYGNSITQTLEYKPAICDSVSAYLSEDKTEIRLCLNSSLYDVIPEIISVWDIDSTFSDNAQFTMLYYRDPVGAFNDQGQFLTIAMNKGENFSLNLCIIEYDFSDSTYSGIEIKSTKRIPYLGAYIPISNIQSFGNYFYVLTSNYNYIINTMGEYHIMDNLPASLQIFSYNDTLFTFTSNNWLYYSTDLGYNWNEYVHFSAWVSFFEISGKLCCHRRDDIYEINFDTDEVKELDNWGLEGNEITSINEFNDKVYISTLSGLFYRELDEFFTYKEEDGGKENLKFEKY